MDFVEVFSRMASLAQGVTARRKSEMKDFLTVHRKIVETIPSEVATTFDNMHPTPTRHKGADHNYGIMLTVADHLWWKEIVAEGGYFIEGVETVKNRMLQRLAAQIEKSGLEAKERAVLLAMFD